MDLLVPAALLLNLLYLLRLASLSCAVSLTCLAPCALPRPLVSHLALVRGSHKGGRAIDEA
eukprot:scaffold191750_cov31-Tisochrysis_lutea.AAC.8